MVAVAALLGASSAFAGNGTTTTTTTPQVSPAASVYVEQIPSASGKTTSAHGVVADSASEGGGSFPVALVAAVAVAAVAIAGVVGVRAARARQRVH